MPYLFVASGFGLHLTYQKSFCLFDFYVDRLTRMICMLWLVIAVEFFFDRLPHRLQPHFQPSPTPLSNYLRNAASLGMLRPVVMQAHNLIHCYDTWPQTGYIVPTTSERMNAWLSAYAQNLPTILHLWFLSYTILCTLLYPVISRLSTSSIDSVERWV